MPEIEHRERVALELNALHATGALGDVLEEARIGAGTPIHDLNGTLLYERVPLAGERVAGSADVAVEPAIGGVLMSVSHGLAWDERALVERAHRAAARRLGDDARPIDDARFVAYSYPKIGVQLLSGGEELILLELYSWLPVPARRDRAPGELPASFDRWSFLDDQPAEVLEAGRQRFDRRVAELGTVPGRDRVAPDRIARSQLAGVIEPRPRRGEDAERRGPDEVEGDHGGEAGGDVAGGDGGGGVGAGGGAAGGGGAAAAGATLDERELHFSTRSLDHATCYEVVGQVTPVWCVAASVQMLLDFYRYEYTQDRVATALGLGTRLNAYELPKGKESKVVEAIKALSSDALVATKVVDPTWDDFRDEIVANRPVVSFVPGHSRTIAGYTDTGPMTATLGPFRGLLVYDPWPQNAGVVTRWENVDVRIYTFAFTAHLRLA